MAVSDFEVVIVYGHRAVVKITAQRSPTFKAVIQRLGNPQTFMHTLALGDHPGMKRVHQGRGFFLTYSSPDIRFQIADFAFNLIQSRDIPQCLLGQHAFFGDVLVVELAAGAGHAADFSDAKCKTGFVTAVVVTDQLAFPVAQKVAGILPERPGLKSYTTALISANAVVA